MSPNRLPSRSPSPPPAAEKRQPPLPRQTRSDFDLEPNPFEKSFSDQRQSSNDSPEQPRPGSRTSTNRSQSPKPVLPPVASLRSPADSFSWYSNNNPLGSLRDGPLSPALLDGPTDKGPPQQLQFDSSAFRFTPRTGFTPGNGNGTGLTPFVNGTAFPPTPGTQNFLSMINGALGPPTGPTVVPGNLSGSFASTNSQQHAPQQPSGLHNSHTQPQESASHTDYVMSASTAASTAANGLFLLSQAHQELTKREEQARAGNTNGTTNGATHATSNGKRGTKRKSSTSYEPEPVNTRSRRTRANTGASANSARGARKGSVSEDMMGDEEEEEDDDDGDNDDGAADGPKKNKKPETEEEKRKNFLERNRQAALKCRQRKKAWLAQLQAKVEFLTNENERLTSALVSSREEISRLSALVGSAAVGPTAQLHPNGAAPVSMNVSLGGKGVGVSVGGGRGYGY